MNRFMRRFGTLALMMLFVPGVSSGYSVLTHEAIVDSTWESAMKPLLLLRYPGTTEEQLREAKSYAYGGCVIQDLGYYPFGSHLFTDLVHYVRSGDFGQNLLRDAQNVDEYAFALGALSHFFADSIGHPVAINRSVPMAYPKLRNKFGNEVTCEEGKKEHILVEFSFDVIQVAGTAYAPQAYHDFIGFQVAKPLLERAFQETYGLQMRDIFFHEDLSIGTYRRAVSKAIPHITRVAWSQKSDQIARLVPGIQRNRFIYSMSRREYRRDFGEEYRRGFGAAFLGFLLRIVPKIGPFRALGFPPPPRQMEGLFQESFKLATLRYDEVLVGMKSEGVMLRNQDCDTGAPTRMGEHALADETYGQLLDKLAAHNFQGVTAALRNDIVRFYATPSAGSDPATRQEKRWEKTQKQLGQLKTATAENEVIPNDQSVSEASGEE